MEPEEEVRLWPLWACEVYDLIAMRQRDVRGSVWDGVLWEVLVDALIAYKVAAVQSGSVSIEAGWPMADMVYASLRYFRAV